jgi:hypothetical protein
MDRLSSLIRFCAAKIRPSQLLKDLSSDLLKVVDRDLCFMYNPPILTTTTTTTDKPPDFKAIADKIRRYIARLQEDRDRFQSQVEWLNNQIAQQELILSSLAPLVEDVKAELQENLFVEGVADGRLTDAVFLVLTATPSYRSARGVRDALDWSGYDLKQHKNPLASIHGVLKRLVEAGRIEEIEINGSMRYRRKVNPNVKPPLDTRKLVDWLVAQRNKEDKD